MKKVLLIMIAMTAAVTAFAQFPKGLSVGAGYGSGNKTFKSDGFDDQTIKTGGFYFGATYNLAIGESGLGVAPGLYMHFDKGDASDYLAPGAKLDLKETSLSVPVFVNYAIPVADILKVTPFVGPSLMYNFTAKLVAEDDEVNMYKDDPANGFESTYKHVNLFVGGGVALDIADIVRVSVGYDYGLLNRSSADGSKILDSRLHLGVAYLF